MVALGNQMKLELIVEGKREVGERKHTFHLIVHNFDTGERCTLMTGSSMAEVKTRSSEMFGIVVIRGRKVRGVQWCDGDDPTYDSTEYFSLESEEAQPV